MYMYLYKTDFDNVKVNTTVYYCHLLVILKRKHIISRIIPHTAKRNAVDFFPITYISKSEQEHAYRHFSPYMLFEQGLHFSSSSDVYPLKQAIR